MVKQNTLMSVQLLHARRSAFNKAEGASPTEATSASFLRVIDAHATTATNPPPPPPPS